MSLGICQLIASVQQGNHDCGCSICIIKAEKYFCDLKIGLTKIFALFAGFNEGFKISSCEQSSFYFRLLSNNI